MRWALVLIAACACKDAPSRQATRQPPLAQSAANGAQREPEVDAAIDAMRPALLLAEPTETISGCEGPLEVFAIDHEAALLIAAGRAPPEGVHFTTPAEIDAVVRYASKSALGPGDVDAIRAWAKARPRDAVWGFLETTAVARRARPDGGYEGVLHVIDARTKAVLCHTPVTARSSDKGEVATAVSGKLAALRAGTDVVTLPDPETDNRGPLLARDRIAETEKWHCSRSTSDRKASRCYRDKAGCATFYEDMAALGYTRCETQSTVACFTYRDLAAEKDAFWCHTTMEACLHHRRVAKTDPDHPASEVSACAELGSTPKKP